MEDNNRLTDNESLLYEIGRLSEIPKRIVIESRLTEYFNGALLLGNLKRWKEIAERFQKPVYIYALCKNPVVGKFMQNLVMEHEEIDIVVMFEEKGKK